ncbi:ribonuclease H-like domain-containing protein [Tanacetum coccineum]
MLVGSMVLCQTKASRIESNAPCVKNWSVGGVTRLKQHIAQITGQTTSCPKATKEDQLKCRNAINEGKLKNQGKRQHDEAIRSEVRLDSNESLKDDEVHDDSMKEPNVFGPMHNFANTVNPEQSLKRKVKGKNVELSNSIRKERMWMTKKYVARWAYESAIPFHAFEKDSFKMLLEVVGQFRPGLPPPTRYELSTPLLKEEVERTKNLVKRNKKEWKEIGCSIMTDAWSDRKRRSIMNLCLRMVDADWKPSMGFVYREVIKAKEEIKAVLGDNKKAYEPIIKIIEKKMKGRLDTVLHLMAYLLNPYYFYKNTKIQHDPDISDAVLAFFEIILAGDLEMQLEVTNVEMPKYKKQMDRFGKELAIFACEVNNEKYDPAKRRKARDVEVLLSNDGNMAQEWIVECDGDGNRNRDEEVEVQDQQDQEAQWEVIGEAMEADEYLQPRQSSRTTTKTTQRELFDEEFESGSEEVVYEEGDYESDGVKIIEGCGDED